MENTDYVVIAGGDGSLSEVITSQRFIQECVINHKTNLPGSDRIFKTTRCFCCCQKYSHWHCATGRYKPGSLLNFWKVWKEGAVHRRSNAGRDQRKHKNGRRHENPASNCRLAHVVINHSANQIPFCTGNTWWTCEACICPGRGSMGCLPRRLRASQQILVLRPLPKQRFHDFLLAQERAWMGVPRADQIPETVLWLQQVRWSAFDSWGWGAKK